MFGGLKKRLKEAVEKVSKSIVKDDVKEEVIEKKQEQTKTLRETRAELAKFGEQVTVQMFSSLKKTGIEEAEQAIAPWLAQEAAFAVPAVDVGRGVPAAVGSG